MKSYTRQAQPHEHPWSRRKILLNRLSFVLTERCNNNCLHCYINRPENDTFAKEEEIGTDAIFKILEEAAVLGCRTIVFSGGEPLLRPDFPQLYTYTRRLGMSVNIYTNGRRISRDLAELFREVTPGGKVVITLYGISPASYEAVTRIKGGFTEVRRGIEALRQNEVPFQIVVPLLPQNLHEQDQVGSWLLKEYGINDARASQMLLDLHIRRDRKRSEEIKKQRLSPEEQLAIRLRDPELLRKDFLVYFRPRKELRNKQIFLCGAGKHIGTVGANGKLQMCSRLLHPETVCDLSSHSLADAFLSFFPQVRAQNPRDIDFLRKCGRCFLRGYCEACPGASWSETGSLENVHEYACRVAHLEARAVGLLAEDENGWSVENWLNRIEAFIKDTCEEKRSDL